MPVELVYEINPSTKGPGLWKMNASLMVDKKYLDEINKLIDKYEVVTHSDRELDPALSWELLKLEISKLTRKYFTERARLKRETLNKAQRRLQAVQKKLAMINVNSSMAIRQIEKVNAKIDILQAEIDREMEYRARGAILRSRTKLYHEGEHNTKYFFSLEKTRSKNKSMTATK